MVMQEQLETAAPAEILPGTAKIGWITFLCIILPLAALVCYGYYYYIYNIKPDAIFINYYGMLGHSFLEGHTYLDIKPLPEILALPDPYDYHTSEKFCMWDASLYKGKYYLYFGPVPAALIWAPIRYFTGYAVTDPMMVLGFTITGTLCIMLLLASFAARQRIMMRMGFVFCALAISFGTWIPFMLRRPSFYEVALSGAYCFNAIAALLLWTGLNSKRNYFWFALASLCFGLAVGSRAVHIFNIAALGLVWLFYVRKRPVMATVALFGPWAFCLACIMYYNFVRFDDPFEPGIHYIISQFNPHDPNFKMLTVDKIIPNFYYYFLRPLEWFPGWKFPFINVKYYDIRPLFWGITAETYEPLYGLFSNSPFALWIFAALYCCWFRGSRYTREGLLLLAALTLYMSGVIGYLLVCVFTTARYSVDFCPWFMFLASTQYLRLLKTVESKKIRFVLLTIGWVAATYGVFTNMMSGYCGQYLCTQSSSE